MLNTYDVFRFEMKIDCTKSLRVIARMQFHPYRPING